MERFFPLPPTEGLCRTAWSIQVFAANKIKIEKLIKTSLSPRLKAENLENYDYNECLLQWSGPEQDIISSWVICGP